MADHVPQHESAVDPPVSPVESETAVLAKIVGDVYPDVDLDFGERDSDAAPRGGKLSKLLAAIPAVCWGPPVMGVLGWALGKLTKVFLRWLSEE